MLLINQINNMESPKCDTCKFEAQGETLTIGLNQCMHTYVAEHADLTKAIQAIYLSKLMSTVISINTHPDLIV